VVPGEWTKATRFHGLPELRSSAMFHYSPRPVERRRGEPQWKGIEPPVDARAGAIRPSRGRTNTSRFSRAFVLRSESQVRLAFVGEAIRGGPASAMVARGNAGQPVSQMGVSRWSPWLATNS
jgi:hypothetical protein